MTELNGLAQLMSQTHHGHRHAIAEQPYRFMCADEQEYQQAFDAWYRRTTYWRAHKTSPRPLWHDDCLPTEA